MKLSLSLAILATLSTLDASADCRSEARERATSQTLESCPQVKANATKTCLDAYAATGSTAGMTLHNCPTILANATKQCVDSYLQRFEKECKAVSAECVAAAVVRANSMGLVNCPEIAKQGLESCRQAYLSQGNPAWETMTLENCPKTRENALLRCVDSYRERFIGECK